MTAKNANESAKDQYYAELETLEPDARLQEAIRAARMSSSQRKLVETWSSKRTTMRNRPA